MCGLFAGVGKLNVNRMTALGSMNEERGIDSVGIAYVSEKQIHLAKVAERASVGLNITLRKEMTAAAISGMFIGHTRQATQGAITSENAHPFLMEGIAFAHNGIIMNDEYFGKYDVDSQSLIHGIKAKDFSKYEGCIALVWIENGKLMAFRSGNPLFRGRHGDTTYLSSLKDHLEDIGCIHIRELKEGFIYTFHDSVNISTKKVPENKSYAPVLYTNSILSHYKEMYDKEDKFIEDFNTWKDDVKEHEGNARKACSVCWEEATKGEFCDSCHDWMTAETNKDTPIETKVW